MIWLLFAPFACYQLLALAAILKHLFSRDPPAPLEYPAVSILKPVRGADPGFAAALRSHALQDYPAEFEILVGARAPDDGAFAEVEKLRREFPRLPLRAMVCPTEAPNGKVGTLIDLEKAARHGVLVVNDADIRVGPSYLRRVAEPLADPRGGLVTCLYRAEGTGFASRFEALGICTDFAPSALVAPLVGVSEFALGSTLAFRRADLARAGGFEAIAAYLADDYQLGKRIHGLGLRNRMSREIVATRMAADSWKGIWKHQVRWARTIRLSRGAGYAGLPVTNASLWALIALLSGHGGAAALLLGLRLAVAFTSGWILLGSADVLRLFPLIPLRDFWALGVWAAGLFGNSVEWRGSVFRLDRQGRVMR